MNKEIRLFKDHPDEVMALIWWVQSWFPRKPADVDSFPCCWKLVELEESSGLAFPAAVLVILPMLLTWQALLSRPDWIKSLLSWKIECCCQLDTSTSLTPCFPLPELKGRCVNFLILLVKSRSSALKVHPLLFLSPLDHWGILQVCHNPLGSVISWLWFCECHWATGLGIILCFACLAA